MLKWSLTYLSFPTPVNKLPWTFISRNRVKFPVLRVLVLGWPVQPCAAAPSSVWACIWHLPVCLCVGRSGKMARSMNILHMLPPTRYHPLICNSNPFSVLSRLPNFISGYIYLGWWIITYVVDSNLVFPPSPERTSSSGGSCDRSGPSWPKMMHTSLRITAGPWWLPLSPSLL